MIQAVLFDCDGTLADSEPMITASIIDMLADEGITVTVDQVRGVFGPPLLEMAELLIGERVTPERMQRMRERYWVHAGPRYASVRPMAGAETLLDALAAHAVPLAMVTNKTEASTAVQIAQFGWDGRFSAVVCADSVANAKPAPDPAIEALRRLASAPARAAFVGDTESDTACARDAGIPLVIGLTGTRNAAHLLAHGATHTVDRLDQVLPLLLAAEIRA
ncbi:MAG: HAD family hydrolase [Chloroflexi bacterium]|nr:HAD family hydrolase [Chloroflexota bacterium]